jgi:signal transduction histidine kinase
VRDEIAFGLQPGGELRVETTICNEIRDTGEAVVIDRVADDEVFCRHPTPKMYGFQSYISVPITRPDGEFFGTFKLFARLIGFHLAAQDRLRASETALATERPSVELREQFIAVLCHDLRNPLTAIDVGAQRLFEMPLGDRATRIATLIENSAARMAGLIDNVLDFGRARLGGGIGVVRAVDPRLAARLEHVVAELRTAWPDRVSTARFRCAGPSPATARASPSSSPICSRTPSPTATRPVRSGFARGDESGFELSVANRGEPIPPDTVDRLFQPFQRASARPGQQGPRARPLHRLRDRQRP